MMIDLADWLDSPADAGAVLRAMRLDVGLGPDEMAQAMRDQGEEGLCSHWTGVAMTEAGTYDLSLATLYRWARACGCRVRVGIDEEGVVS